MLRSIQGGLPQRHAHARGGFMKGCLIVVAVLVVLAIIGAVIVAMMWRSIVGGMVRSVAEQAINNSALSDADKEGMMKQIDRMIVAFENEELDQAKAEKFFKQLSKSPIIHVGAVKIVEQNYVDQSGLSNVEKAEGKLTLQRFARGVFEEKIDKGKAQELWEMLTVTDAEGKTTMKETLTDEELKDLMAKAKAAADAADIPEEDFEIDIVGEFKKAVDAALGEEEAPAP